MDSGRSTADEDICCNSVISDFKRSLGLVFRCFFFVCLFLFSN